MAIVTIVRPGLLTTIQDCGRWGFQRQGVSVAGAMDLPSHRLANALVGNSSDAATFEATMIGPEIAFNGDSVIAVTGGEFDLTVGGRAVAMNQALAIRSGDRLTFGRRRRGCRAYVAVAGGLDVPPVLGSRSTHVPSRMGGLEGRALRAGDRVPMAVATMDPMPRGVDVLLEPQRADRIRIIPGPQADHFTASTLETLASATYTIRSESDRMGYRLEGKPLTHRSSAEIITDATPIGALQVPASGQPILLMADRQTTGGYPIVATVITADLDQVAQLAPGDPITFRLCDRDEAVQALSAYEEALLQVERGGRR